MLGTQVANILEVCLLLILIWVLWFECWQKYRVDLFRQNLFELSVPHSKRLD